MKINNPYAFLLILPLILCFVLKKIFPVIETIPFTFAYNGRINTYRIIFIRFLDFLFILGGILAIVALADPKYKIGILPEKSDKVAVELVVDISGSMRREDITSYNGKISRIESARNAVSFIIKNNPWVKFGIVTFGGYALTRAPLTFDHLSLLKMVDDIQIPSITEGEEELLTSIGDGIALACAKLSSNVNVKNKVAVLITDGRQTVKSPYAVTPEKAVEYAIRNGIRIYTIAIVPSEKNDSQQDSPDIELLKFISGSTGGEHYTVNSYEKLIDSFKMIESTEIMNWKIERLDLYASLRPFILLLTVLIFFIVSIFTPYLKGRIL